MNVTFPAEVRDNRGRRVGKKVYRAPPCDVDEYVDRGAHAVRARGYTKVGNLDADRFCAIPSVLPEAARNEKNRVKRWVDRWKNRGNRGPSELTAVGAVEIPSVQVREEQRYK